MGQHRQRSNRRRRKVPVAVPVYWHSPETARSVKRRTPRSLATGTAPLRAALRVKREVQKGRSLSRPGRGEQGRAGRGRRAETVLQRAGILRRMPVT